MAYEYKRTKYTNNPDIVEEMNREGKDDWEVIDFVEKTQYVTVQISTGGYGGITESEHNILYKRKVV